MTPKDLIIRLRPFGVMDSCRPICQESEIISSGTDFLLPAASEEVYYLLPIQA